MHKRTPDISSNKVPSHLKRLNYSAGPPQVIGDIEKLNFSHCGSLLSFELRISFAGYPQPTVTWTKDSTAIVPDARVRTSTSPSYQSLIIRDAEPSDDGLYQVTLHNRHGSVKRQVHCCGRLLNSEFHRKLELLAGLCPGKIVNQFHCCIGVGRSICRELSEQRYGGVPQNS